MLVNVQQTFDNMTESVNTGGHSNPYLYYGLLFYDWDSFGQRKDKVVEEQVVSKQQLFIAGFKFKYRMP